MLGKILGVIKVQRMFVGNLLVTTEDRRKKDQPNVAICIAKISYYHYMMSVC